MRRVVIPQFGAPDVLQIDDGPAPSAGPGTVRIRVEAVGLNFADLLMRQGMYPEAPPVPFTPGYDVAGTLLELPPDGLPESCQWMKPGCRVMAVTKFGGCAEEVVTPATKTVPLPDAWSFEQGAGFLIAHVTAWLGLVPMAKVEKGDQVLIHGIAGGVGLAAAQIARAAGATVAGTCSGSKLAAVKDQGIELAIDYNDPELAQRLKQWAPDGPTLIFEPRGGQGLKESLEAVRPLGRVVIYGFREIMEKGPIDPAKAEMTTGRLLWFNPLTLVQRSIGVHMLNIMNLWDDQRVFLSAATALGDGIRAGHYEPVIDRVFDFNDVAEAHRFLESRKNVGKVILKITR